MTKISVVRRVTVAVVGVVALLIAGIGIAQPAQAEGTVAVPGPVSQPTIEQGSGDAVAWPGLECIGRGSRVADPTEPCDEGPSGNLPGGGNCVYQGCEDDGHCIGRGSLTCSDIESMRGGVRA